MPQKSKTNKEAVEDILKIESSQVDDSYWEGLKRWFKHSESILISRLEVLTGFVVTTVSALDWSPLLSIGAGTDFTWKQGVTLGSMLMVKGVFSEWARRRNSMPIDQTVTVSVKGK